MIEIDQSNKIERTAQSSILAMCNGHKRTILIPARVKREALKRLRSKGKGRNLAFYQLFAAGLFILLEPHLGNSREIILPSKRYFLELLEEFPRISGDFIAWKFLTRHYQAQRKHHD